MDDIGKVFGCGCAILIVLLIYAAAAWVGYLIAGWEGAKWMLLLALAASGLGALSGAGK